jgi:hypothetical protein
VNFKNTIKWPLVGGSRQNFDLGCPSVDKRTINATSDAGDDLQAAGIQNHAYGLFHWLLRLDEHTFTSINHFIES